MKRILAFFLAALFLLGSAAMIGCEVDPDEIESDPLRDEEFLEEM
jgi:hypothetical protein